MVYHEKKDPLSGKAERHSKSEALSNILGLGRSIIIDESPERVNMVGAGKIIYQNNAKNLTVYDSDVVKAYNKLENIDETSRNVKWDEFADDVLISLGFGNKNIPPFSVVGSKSYSDLTYAMMNFFESERAKNRGRENGI